MDPRKVEENKKKIIIIIKKEKDGKFGKYLGKNKNPKRNEYFSSLGFLRKV